MTNQQRLKQQSLKQQSLKQQSLKNQRSQKITALRKPVGGNVLSGKKFYTINFKAWHLPGLIFTKKKA
jgi:hypothetical protein